MSEHHGPSQETDITAVLVIAFVLVVGVLIAKTAGDFTRQTTSTSSRAAEPRLESNSLNNKNNVNSLNSSSSLIVLLPTPTPVTCAPGSTEPWFGKCISSTDKFCPKPSFLNMECKSFDPDHVSDTGYIQYQTGASADHNIVLCPLSLGNYCRPQKVIKDFNSDNYCKRATNSQDAVCLTTSPDGFKTTNITCPIEWSVMYDRVIQAACRIKE